jgi:biotin-[acetyl-CoA-carboxylase] ligase BirA-like protein
MKNVDFLSHVKRLRTHLSAQSLLMDTTIEWQSEWVEKIDSTNKQLRDRASEGLQEGSLLIAHEQAKGSGRHGREWVADPGKGLLFSFFIEMKLKEERPGLIGHLTALSMLKALRDLPPKSRPHDPPTLYWKWPNDLMAMEMGSIAKLAGILVQTQVMGSSMKAVVGMGLNLGRSEFPPDLRQPATTLQTLGWETMDEVELLAAFCVHFERGRSFLSDPKALFAELEPFDLLRSRPLFLQSKSPSMEERVEMYLDSHLDDGRIQLDVNGEKRFLAAGELRLLRADASALYFEEPKN